MEYLPTSGLIDDASVAELLAEAYNLAFSGRLELALEGQPGSSIEFWNGAVFGASGPWRTAALERELIGELLPEHFLDLARSHATRQELGLVGAIERLRLLPNEALNAVRERLVVRGVRALCALPGETRFAFVASEVAATGPTSSESPLEPLNLIALCVGCDDRTKRAELVVSSFEGGELSLDPLGARSLLAALSGPVRPVVLALAEAPTTAAALRERFAASEATLTASLYTLWLTQHLRVRSEAAVAPSGRASLRADRPAGAHTELATPSPERLSPPSVSGVPQRPNPSLALPSHAPGSPARHELIKERALEDKVLEAWSLAQADPTRVERVAVFIRKAARVFPRNSRIRFLSACLLELEGRPGEALAELERLLRSDPDHEDAMRELRRLQGSLAPRSVGDRLKRLFGKGG